MIWSSAASTIEPAWTTISLLNVLFSFVALRRHSALPFATMLSPILKSPMKLHRSMSAAMLSPQKGIKDGTGWSVRLQPPLARRAAQCAAARPREASGVQMGATKSPQEDRVPVIQLQIGGDRSGIQALAR